MRGKVTFQRRALSWVTQGYPSMTLSVGPPVNRDTSRSWLTLDLKVGLIPGVIWLASLQPHFFLRYFKGSLLKARVLIEEQGSEQDAIYAVGK